MDKKTTVVFGCGNLGTQVAEHLRERSYDPLMVSADEAMVEFARGKGFDAVLLDYTHDEALRSIGIGDYVKVVFCMFPVESKNVFLTISARALAPELKIVSVAESADAGGRLLAAGASKVIDPYQITGHKIHELTRRPLIVETLESTIFGRENLDLAEIEIPAESGLSGSRADDLNLEQRYNLVLLGVVDWEMGDELIFRTSGVDHKLDAGDLLVVIGPRDRILRFRHDIRSPEPDIGRGEDP